MKPTPCLFIALLLLVCGCLPSTAEPEPLRLPSWAEEGEELRAPEWALYYATSDFHVACRALQPCIAQPELKELVELMLPRAQARLAAYREHLAACTHADVNTVIRDEARDMLNDCERLLSERAQKPVELDSLTPLLSLLPEDDAGEPWLTAQKAQERLRVATEALFSAFAEQEYRHVASSGELKPEELRELLRLSREFRREMMLWGRRSLTEARLQRWRAEELTTRDAFTMGYYERPGWMEYLRADAEEARADYEMMQRRLRCRAASFIRYQLRYGKNNAAALTPTEPSWLMGEGMPASASAELALFYRLRDGLAFALMARPEVVQPSSEWVPLVLAVEGEALVMSSAMGEYQRAGKIDTHFILNSSRFGWHRDEQLAKKTFFHRAGVDVVALMAPADGVEQGHARVEAQANRLRALLDAAEKQLPQFPDTVDAACRRLLVELVAHWNAYVTVLKRWGYVSHGRGFVWGGGCCGLRPFSVWGDDDDLDFLCSGPKEGQSAREWLRDLLTGMRGELEASFAEHQAGPSSAPEAMPSPLLRIEMPETLEELPSFPPEESTGGEGAAWETAESPGS